MSITENGAILTQSGGKLLMFEDNQPGAWIKADGADLENMR